MNAVNLLPSDLRRGAGSPGRSGVGVYVVLGVLAAAVVLASVTALLNRSVADRKAEVARVEAEATAAEQRAGTLTRYKTLAAETGRRVQGIKKVAAGRVDWSKSLREVSEAIGSEVYFTSVSGTTAAGSGSGSGGGSANPLRGAINAPAVDIAGCARDHKAVARLMTRFRAMDDVKRVSLAASDTGAGSGATADAAASDGGCRAGGRLPAEFSAVIFLDHEGAPVAAATAAGGTAAATPQGGTK